MRAAARRLNAFLIVGCFIGIDAQNRIFRAHFDRSCCSFTFGNAVFDSAYLAIFARRRCRRPIFPIARIEQIRRQTAPRFKAFDLACFTLFVFFCAFFVITIFFACLAMRARLGFAPHSTFATIHDQFAIALRLLRYTFGFGGAFIDAIDRLAYLVFAFALDGDAPFFIGATRRDLVAIAFRLLWLALIGGIGLFGLAHCPLLDIFNANRTVGAFFFLELPFHALFDHAGIASIARIGDAIDPDHHSFVVAPRKCAHSEQRKNS